MKKRGTLQKNLLPTPKMLWNAPAHYEKSGALRKNWHPKPPSGTRNHKQEPVL